MNALQEVPALQTGSAIFEGRISHWRVVLWFATMLAMIIYPVWGFTATSGEIAIGAAMAATFLLLAILSNSVERCKRSLSVAPPLPWSKRRSEMFFRATFVVIFLLINYYLMTLEFTPAQHCIAMLAMFSLLFALGCLDSWYTVARAIKEQQVKASLYETSMSPWPGSST